MSHYIPKKWERLEAAKAAGVVVVPLVKAWIEAGNKRTPSRRVCNEWDVVAALSACEEWEGARLCARLDTIYGWPVDMALASLLHTFSCMWRERVEAEQAARVDEAAAVARRAKGAGSENTESQGAK